MQKKIMASFALAASVAFSVPANATTVTILGAGVLSNSVGDSSATFDTVPGAPQTYNGTVTPFGPFSDNTGSFTGQGMIMLNGPGGTQGSLGLYAEPLHDTTNYLTVMPAGSPENLALGSTFARFGLYWGSMDTYNTISFYKGATLVDSLTGGEVAAFVPAPATGGQVGDQNNRYVEFTNVGNGLGFDNIVLSSTANSFEVDNLSWGPANGPSQTPLPGALPLFVSGMGGLGFLRFLRKKRTAKVAAV